MKRSQGREKVEDIYFFNTSERMEVLNLWIKALGKVGHIGEEIMETLMARLQWGPVGEDSVTIFHSVF